MVELQTLALVDREDTDAVGGRILDGLAANGFLPFADKGINVGAVVEREFVQLVVEGTDVGAPCWRGCWSFGLCRRCGRPLWPPVKSG